MLVFNVHWFGIAQTSTEQHGIANSLIWINLYFSSYTFYRKSFALQQPSKQTLTLGLESSKRP